MTFGITNKPFLFQYIVDFTPNLASFGKAFGMEGLLQFKAHSTSYHYRIHRPTYITSPFIYGATLKVRLYWKYTSSNNLILSSYQVSLKLRRQFEDYKLGDMGTIIKIPKPCSNNRYTHIISKINHPIRRQVTGLSNDTVYNVRIYGTGDNVSIVQVGRYKPFIKFHGILRRISVQICIHERRIENATT